jgi:hypothetical protein
MIRRTIALCLACFILGIPAMMAAPTGDSARFDQDIRPILEERCFRCHGPEKQKNDLRLDTLSTDLLNDSAAAETWHDVLGALNLGEMPPDDEEQPTDGERRKLIGWLTHEIENVVAANKSTGGRPVLRRLNRVEYQNTMRDLLGIETDFAANLPPEGLSPDGFKNNGAALQMSALQLEYYLDAARSSLDKVIVSGPAPKVFHHVLDEGNADGGKPEKQFDHSNVLDRTHLFITRIEEDYPEQGEFLIRVRARAELTDNKKIPRMEVSLGFRADTQFPKKVTGATDVASTRTNAYDFRGRIEDFPLPSRVQSKFPGILIKVANTYNDGTPLPKQETVEVPSKNPKKPKKIKVWPEETHIPKIHIESVEFVGPVFESWPPKQHTDILFPSKLRNKNEAAYANAVLKRFMMRAYRRPVSDDEIQPFLFFFNNVRPTLSSFEEAARETLAMVLISPDFLYLVEPAADEKRPLNDWEIASRLSYFLWSTMPDENLFTAAEKGTLTKPPVLKRTVARMLEDERSWAFIDQFVDQWLDVGAVDRVAVNPEFYPDWNNDLKPSIREETKHFFAEILSHRLSALNFLDSDFAMLNAPLARHYGIPGPRGTDFERVSLTPGHQRGGLLAQASVLLGNSTGEDSHPVKRAVWIRERLLDDPPADPPPNVPSLDEVSPDFAKLPVRRQLEAHREEASCNDCHRAIDPWGIAMEGFGADGLHRDAIPRQDSENKNKIFNQPVESDTTLPDGTPITGLAELKSYLAESKRDQFARALVTKLLTYSLGRSLELTDEEAVDNLTTNFIAQDLNLHHLVQQVATSQPFLTK